MLRVATIKIHRIETKFFGSGKKKKYWLPRKYYKNIVSSFQALSIKIKSLMNF